MSLFTLDIIYDQESDRFVVIDVNGCRSTIAAFRELYGDDRVERAALTLVAEHGQGRIHAPSHISEPALRLCGLPSLQDAPDCGLNRTAEAYVPPGSPYDLSEEEATARLARWLGFEYVRWTARWDADAEQLVLSAPGEATAALGDWRPEGVVWPFSWNLRRFAFNESCRLASPLGIYLLTTNKLLLSRKLNGSTMPPSSSFNFLDEDVTFAKFTDLLAPGQLAVVKPASGRRGYGLFTPRQSDIGMLAHQMGVAVSYDRAEMGALLFALAALQGEGWDYLALIQPFMPGHTRQHPGTSSRHLVTIRALVHAFGGKARLIDMCEILHRDPVSLSNGMARGSLISSGQAAALMPVPTELAERVARTAERTVDEVVGLAAKGSHFEAIEREIEEMLPLLSERSNLPFMEIFNFARRRLSKLELPANPPNSVQARDRDAPPSSGITAPVTPDPARPVGVGTTSRPPTKIYP